MTSGYDAQLDFVVPADDTYFLRVEPGGGVSSQLLDETGTYTISMTYVGDDAAGIFVQPVSGLITTESGGSAPFSIVLNTEPVGNVIIEFLSSDTSEGTTASSNLTFTPGNWYLPQDMDVVVRMIM